MNPHHEVADLGLFIVMGSLLNLNDTDRAELRAMCTTLAKKLNPPLPKTATPLCAAKP